MNGILSRWERIPKKSSMHRFIHFDIYDDDVDRADGFYSGVFGWEISKWEDGAPEMDYRLITMGEDSPCPESGITRRPPVAWLGSTTRKWSP